MYHQITTPLKIAGLCLMPLLSPFPAQAQDSNEEPGLMERGVEMFLRGLIDEVGPEVGQMQDALKAMQPEFEKLITLMGDFKNYETPERLPNGDILIRRKAGAPPPADLPGDDAGPPSPATPPNDSIDL
ncbi:AAA+ family ATPase [Gemmobacter serpentinus]|uniref:AAA+ family ATPase n=1 Tax=Gemmobacter serpentinus TaxID=2652247 RepID=UPI0018657834|nr:AAA+ family ATPase [Gemmobacter serpentinus]